MYDFTNDSLEEEETLIAVAEMGDRARQFLGTELGQFLMGCAGSEVDECARELLNVDPSDVEKIRAIQMRAATADNFTEWVNEALTMGDMAFQQIAANELN